MQSTVLINDLKYFHSAVSTTAMSATVGRQKKNKQTQKSSQMMMILMLINNKQKSIKSCCEKHKSVRMEKDHYFVKKFLAVDLVCLFFLLFCIITQKDDLDYRWIMCYIREYVNVSNQWYTYLSALISFLLTQSHYSTKSWSQWIRKQEWINMSETISFLNLFTVNLVNFANYTIFWSNSFSSSLQILLYSPYYELATNLLIRRHWHILLSSFKSQ